MLDTTQNCCRSRLALDHKLLTNSATVAKKISQNISKSLVCHRFKGVFYPTLSFYTLDLWPCQPWSAIESCNVADLISKRNKLWKRFRDSLEIRNISNLYLHCTEQPPQYWCYPPTVLMLSPHCTEGIPHCTEYPPQYWCYPPLYWCYPPACTDVSPQCTEYPPQYWSYPPLYWCYPPTVLNNLHSTEGIPHSTEAIPPHVLLLSPHSTEGIPPQYWIPSTVLMLSPTVLMLSPHVLMLSPHCTEPPLQYWSYPPQYWSYPPTVLNNLHSTEAIPHSTEAIPHSTDVIPPMYWTTSNVLNNLHSTEPTLCGVILLLLLMTLTQLIIYNLKEKTEKGGIAGWYNFRTNVQVVLNCPVDLINLNVSSLLFD